MTTRPGANADGETRHDPASVAEDGLAVTVLEETLRYARERSYRGWDYGDGMSSRLLRALPVESVYCNLAVQELVKRVPVNVRPLLLVEQRRNFKGVALFAMANQVADWIVERSPGTLAEPEGGYRSETRSLVAWLREHRSTGYSGFCGGHNHEIQHLNGELGVPNDPDVVSTAYAVRALLRAVYIDHEHAAVARTAADFLFEDLDYRPAGTGAVVDYHTNHPDDVVTINAVALAARTLLDLHDHFGEERLRDRATELLAYVASVQTEAGGWYYREPPEASHLSMDSHHNGFVLEAFQRYAEVVDPDRFADTLRDGLAFYRQELFEPDGAPNFDENNRYPRDVHAATQGVLVFSYAGEFDRARQILAWTREHLHAGDGAFYARKHRFHTKRHVLMRWCQAWMAYAAAEYLRCRHVEPT